MQAAFLPAGGRTHLRVHNVPGPVAPPLQPLQLHAGAWEAHAGAMRGLEREAAFRRNGECTIIQGQPGCTSSPQPHLHTYTVTCQLDAPTRGELHVSLRLEIREGGALEDYITAGGAVAGKTGYSRVAGRWWAGRRGGMQV